MLTFRWTRNLDLVRAIMTHPQLFDWLTDDSTTLDTFAPADTAAGWHYLAVEESGHFLGLFAFQLRSAVMAEVHTCLLPAAWGSAARIYRAGLEWTFAHTRLEKVIGNIRANNRLALRAAERAGFTRIGLNQKCVRKGGALLDQWILGFSKEQVQVQTHG